MSVKKQIARNIAKQESAYLNQFGRELVPNWKNFPSAERSLIANLSRNGITLKDLDAAREEGRRSAYRDTAPSVMATMYAATVIEAHEGFGLDEDQCFELLRKIDRKMVEVFDRDELMRECEETCGIRINTREGVGRIEKIR